MLISTSSFSQLPNLGLKAHFKFNYNNHPLSICWKNKDIWKQENTYLLQNLGKNIWNTFVVTYSSSKYKKIIVASRSHIPISNENPEYTFFDKK